ncbi:potassium channel family protein [Microvirga terrestris]|uniref:Two pore domain potassium channel family protein n=1 Tax=Microvirga terrestris TaxID=2791024 RepID=A0ABS0HXL1_9HYPH|nr:potassium channel family protein [Microvirga terrestris]MBF9197900.1 two pore domain potassium channel family protein [Microvirga terrestris]
MLRQLLIGGVISLGNIAIHAVVMATVVGTARRALKWSHRQPQAWLAAAMVATVGVLLVAHISEVVIWSLAYAFLAVAPPEADLLYFAFVNYTTLGYGDVVPVERWRLLGPMAAMNGVLLFGWSTAVIFEVLRQAMRSHDQRGKP